MSIGPATVVVRDGAVGLIDFEAANVSPLAAEIATDHARLLATTAAIAGDERALRAARSVARCRGHHGALPYLQSAAIGPSLRRSLKLAEVDLDQLRKDATELAGVEPPHLAKLRRVTWGTAIQLALLMLAASTIIGALSGVDIDQMRSSLQDAEWAWIVFGFCDRTDAAAEPVDLDDRLGGCRTALRAGVRDAAGDQLHEPGAAIQLRAHGGQHPVLPAAGRAAGRGGHFGSDRLVRRHHPPGDPAGAAADLLAVRSSRSISTFRPKAPRSSPSS